MSSSMVNVNATRSSSGGGTPFLPPVADDLPLDLIETRTFGSRVISERRAPQARPR